MIKSIGVSNYTIEDYEEMMADERVSEGGLEWMRVDEGGWW